MWATSGELIRNLHSVAVAAVAQRIMGGGINVVTDGLHRSIAHHKEMPPRWCALPKTVFQNPHRHNCHLCTAPTFDRLRRDTCFRRLPSGSRHSRVPVKAVIISLAARIAGVVLRLQEFFTHEISF